MKTRLKINVGAFLIVCITGTSVAQDIHFSQFDETPVLLNPANVGVPHEVRVIANYKSQWQSVNAPFKTIAVTVDGRLLKKKKNHLGVGLDFFSDKAGAGQMKTTQINFSLSGMVLLNKSNLISAGLMAGYIQRGINTTSYSWGNQYDGMAYDATKQSGETNAALNFNFVDFAGGIQYSYGSHEMYLSANNAKRLNIGVALFHPHQPAYSFYGDATRLYMKYVFHGDAAIGLKNTNIVLKPSYVVFLQGPTKEITPGLTAQYILQGDSKYTGIKKFMAISLGGYYRASDAAIALIKFEYNSCAIGFSYDINLSKLKTVSNTKGGFEISLRYAFDTYRRGATTSRFF
jgi:type IX secretion system PorP/SprF family membrane protein